jgi:hypothetical protein
MAACETGTQAGEPVREKLNPPGEFAEAKGRGISFKPGKAAPVFGDFDTDVHPDLFVPQDGVCRVFRR